MQISAAARSPDAGGVLMLCKLRRRAGSAPWLWQGDRWNFADSIDFSQGRRHFNLTRTKTSL
ncbi:hypothetical protein DF186_17810 [Enterococcus hirae]|nr:hypothetical protein DF186_17810 [Enterococcus hirae]